MFRGGARFSSLRNTDLVEYLSVKMNARPFEILSGCYRRYVFLAAINRYTVIFNILRSRRLRGDTA